MLEYMKHRESRDNYKIEVAEKSVKRLLKELKSDRATEK